MKLIQILRRAFVWMFAREVLDAINAGATYDEVDRMVHKLSEEV